MPDIVIAIFSAAGVLGIMGFVFGLLLALASKMFFVHEDERKDKILECLPGANCGGCGFAGCGAFADAVLNGSANINLCNAGGQDAADKIAEILGVESSVVDKKIAVVRCSGTSDAAKIKFEYQGMEDCVAAARLLDGYLVCKNGCLGFGSCVAVCSNNALRIDNGVAVVDKSLCGGCGACVKACPKHIIELVSAEAELAVLCSSNQPGAKTKKGCAVGCIGCKICEKNCPENAISVDNFLASFDYDKCISCGVCSEKCPVGIVRSIQ